MAEMPDDDREILRRLLDDVFRSQPRVTRLDIILRAEALDPGEELSELFELLPPGTYNRARLADQLNSAIVGHGWSRRFGTAE